MELRHLRYFCAVAKEMHVTRAAESLRLAQPALTQQIKALENELQVELLRRVGRRVELTAAGAAFRRDAESILERVRLAARTAQNVARGTAGTLAVGLTESAAFSPAVSSLLKRAREHWPEVQMTLVHGHTIELISQLVERRIDIAFIRPPIPGDTELRWRPFVTEAIRVALPNVHPLATRRALKPADLDTEPLILPRGRDGKGALRAEIATAFARAGCGMRLVQEVPEFTTAINLVAAGMGLSLVPDSLTSMRPDAVVYRPLRVAPTLRTQITIVALAANSSPAAENFYKLSASDKP
ncbi:LysR family transcriptional regulator [Bradyrhizobium erythrophlei]|uniref:LysR family transcriptional regulator n=1 Tax=Bradyrhizobium erythrophlei TaxID=1437360 RepID=UPI0035E9076B